MTCEIIESSVPSILSLSDSIRLDLVRRISNVDKVEVNKQSIVEQIMQYNGVKECKHESALQVYREHADGNGRDR